MEGMQMVKILKDYARKVYKTSNREQKTRQDRQKLSIFINELQLLHRQRNDDDDNGDVMPVFHRSFLNAIVKKILWLIFCTPLTSLGYFATVPDERCIQHHVIVNRHRHTHCPEHDSKRACVLKADYYSEHTRWNCIFIFVDIINEKLIN